MNLVKLTKYDKQTGRVLFSMDVIPTQVELHAEDSCEGAVNGLTHYIVNGVAVPRPKMGLVRNGSKINNLPVPCQIFINNAVYDWDDSGIDLDLTYPGVYKITVRAFPFIEESFEITKT